MAGEETFVFSVNSGRIAVCSIIDSFHVSDVREWCGRGRRVSRYVWSEILESNIPTLMRAASRAAMNGHVFPLTREAYPAAKNLRSVKVDASGQSACPNGSTRAADDSVSSRLT